MGGMRTAYLVGMVVVGAVFFGGQDRGQAQQAPAAPHTLWHFLGIPQTVHRSYDGLMNRQGEHPGLERKPRLKALADPANLASDNPAIKAAAEIKQQEDLKPQKIKAIKYLAEIACGCYPGVKEALLAALDDCTEDVRYEAAVAFCRAAGNPCALCNRATCCDRQVKDKLRDVALATDANGCWKEPSARVRAAAEMALRACNQIPTVAPAEVEERKEGPTAVDGKETDERVLEAPVPPAAGTATATLVHPVGLSSHGFDGPAAAAGRSEAGAAGPLGPVSVEHSGVRGIGCRCARCLGRRAGAVCPPAPAAPMPPGVEAAKPAPSPGDERAEGAPEVAAAPEAAALAGSFGAARAPSSAAPHMIGDFLGGNYSYITIDEIEGGASPVSISGGDRNFKIAENNSPIPMDRFFFNYNHFANALETFDGPALPLDRFTFGLEKTFWDENWSVELRVPFARGLDASQVVGQDAGLEGTEFGNVAMAVKTLLCRSQRSALAAGLGIVFPTGADSELILDDGVGGVTTLASVENEAVHFQPFIGYLWVPTDRLFGQMFAQVDFDANGNLTRIRGAEGRLQDQSLLFLDMNIGYWVYRAPNAPFLKGVAPMVELHYTTTLQPPDEAPAGDLVVTPSPYEIDTITNLAGRQDLLNLTGGVHFQLFEATRLTVAAACPLRCDADREFDAEVMLQLNHYY
jgi:hypothetical protein